MAKFTAMLPDKEIKAFKKMYENTDEMLGEMTKAGAEVVAKQVKATVPVQQMASKVNLSKQYKTPSDNGINTQVYISGYLPFSDPNRKYFARRGGSGKMYFTDKGVPADFLANVFEYGRSGNPFPKKPFFRKAFNNKAGIEKAMEQAQDDYFKKIGWYF